MASDETVTKAFFALARAYPDHVDKHLANEAELLETKRLYAKMLYDVPDQLLLAAVETQISRSQWWPKVSELREACVDLWAIQEGLPSAFEAWAEVMRQVRVPHKEQRWSTPLIAEAMDGIGGMQAFGLSPVDQEAAWRARFYQSYESLIRRERTKRVLPQHLLQAMRQNRLPEIGGGGEQLDGES